jgi:fructokinase
MALSRTLFSLGEGIVDFVPKDPKSSFGETSFLPRAGGAPANVACAYAKQGGKSYLLSKFGKDFFGDFLIASFQKEGVDTSQIKRTDRSPTSLSFVSLDEKGERSFSFLRNPGADAFYSEDDLPLKLFQKDAILEFSSVSLANPSMLQAHKKAVEAVKGAGGLIAFDPNLRFALFPDRKLLKERIEAFLPFTDILKVGEDELAFLAEGTEEEAVASFFEKGVKILLISRGENGANLYSKKAKISVKGHSVKTVDTTGAGDGFFGVFLANLPSILSSDPTHYRQALERANVAGSLIVQHLGALPMPSKEEIDQVLE